MRKYLPLVGLALASNLTAFGQTPTQSAEAKGLAAIKLMDEGKLDESIALLQEARRLDPTRSSYPYELGMAYYLQKKYPQVQELLLPLVKRADANERTYELLGNSYDDSGNMAQALATYQAGLRRFPKSGRLHLELGVTRMQGKEYEQALQHFETGLQVAPQFASNYYWAAKLYCASSEPVWGMLYGELFMNLERNSARTPEISKLLFDTYKSHITLKNKDSASVDFSRNIMVMPAKSKKLVLPYGGMVYAPVLLLALAGEQTVDANSLDRIRTKFVDLYYTLPFSKDRPNLVFDYQRQLAQAGHLEAYNHWLLLMGDEQAFTDWEKANPLKWQRFVAWFKANTMQVDKQHQLYRAQYDGR